MTYSSVIVFLLYFAISNKIKAQELTLPIPQSAVANCTSMCTGNLCESGCVGVNTTAKCTGSRCLAVCYGASCLVSCDGDACLAQCTGKKCSATCSGAKCLAKCKYEDCKITCTGQGCNTIDETHQLIQQPPPQQFLDPTKPIALKNSDYVDVDFNADINMKH